MNNVVQTINSTREEIFNTNIFKIPYITIVKQATILATLSFLVGCSSPQETPLSETSTAVPITPPSVFTPSMATVQPSIENRPTQDGTLPDLLLLGFPGITVRDTTVCNDFGPLGTNMIIVNQGGTDSGEFEIQLNGNVRYNIPNIPAQSRMVIRLERLYSSELHIDVTNVVEEQNEDNNIYTERVPIPTQPPTCTPTPKSFTTPTPIKEG